ncbi:hypothetical protein [Pseudomonas rubra]|uniref:Type III secretion apparatus protein OrgA/MxiK n=1 Tax=Pseudomonas rubra TaxID=2942627 RepID=A0ABT5PCT5_9PSED|nr:hypothetical protein [Pseudomonas rubra]MDD1015996.1 hypothetical protein [Pseudomonas rubra]MDD1039233.1 hypothetical protein [Pseudomonas rubra]MDD1155203.1 hypothetical protein [Pseudomonas rubra]
MQPPLEWTERLARHPTYWLSADRLDLPPEFHGPQVRRVLDEVLVQGLELPALPQAWPNHDVTLLWLEHWLLLPRIAQLLGAYRLWPVLARDATTDGLTPALRTFASCTLGPRPLLDELPDLALPLRLETLGLNALLAWQTEVPAGMLARLYLQFPYQVVVLQAELAVAQPDKGLLLMALQHARFTAS